MSHTTKYGDITFIHDGDYSGVVEIVRNNAAIYQNIMIPCETLFQFVANAVREKKIGKLEQSNYDEILGL
jgi:hypothetical protein